MLQEIILLSRKYALYHAIIGCDKFIWASLILRPTYYFASRRPPSINVYPFYKWPPGSTQAPGNDLRVNFLLVNNTCYF